MPAAFVAVTVNVYAVPFVKLVNVHDNAVVVLRVSAPGDAVAVYLITGAAPSDIGADHDTATEPSPATRDGLILMVMGRRIPYRYAGDS